MKTEPEDDIDSIAEASVNSQQEERLQSLVNREKSWFEEEHNKVVFIAKNLPILVLGDHPKEENEKDVFTRVIENLRNQFHSAIPLRDVSRNGNHLYSEKAAIRRYPVVIKVDACNDCNDSKAGSIGENILISSDKKCQEKTFLFLKDTKVNNEMVFSIKHYCMYFPRTYFCKDDDDMVNKAVNIAIREAYRIAYHRYEKMRFLLINV